MAQDNDVAEVLQPEDFALFGGHVIKDGKSMEVWIPGERAVVGFRMSLDNVRATVCGRGMLHVVPVEKRGIIGGFHVQKGRWARISELTIVEDAEHS